MNSSLDSILLNLKIISAIPENGRIRRAEPGVIELDTTDPLISCVTRYIYGDNRHRAVKDIDNIIKNIIEISQGILNSKFLENSKFNIEQSFIKKKLDTDSLRQKELLKTINTQLQGCITGIENLKKTYSRDITTVSSLDIIISKIKQYTMELKITLDFL